MTSATVAWATLAVAGVGVVFAAHPAIRLVAQVAGGLYLLYVAVQLWRAGTGAGAEAGSPMDHAAAFRVGFMTSALNPKIALFYGSVFATALPPAPAPLLVAMAVALVFANSLVWHASLAFLLSRPGVQRAYLRNQRLLNRGSAALVGVFGARLLAATLLELLRNRAAG